jgi:hypothetical protein
MKQLILLMMSLVLTAWSLSGKLSEMSPRYQGMDFSGEAALYDISTLNQSP